MMNVFTKTTGVFLALVSVGATADITVCKMGETTRRVEVAHQDGDSSKPCEVKYHKDTEQPGVEAKVLWKYGVEVTKCKEQADAFVQKLTGMGYSCSAEGAAP
jgi:hypothetical protein